MTAPYRLVRGDALDVLKGLEPGSIDALVTDPPAGIAFMGREWDHDHGGREGWVRAFSAIFSECLRVLKPGGHALVWALPRTSHWTATAIEDAGFEIRDVVTHHYGQGFPKSLDVSKAIDKAAGIWRGRCGDVTIEDQPSKGTEYERTPKGDPATAAAAAWSGWGTALKPASEHWILARKPLGESTVAGNVVKHGTGALNIDGCRIALDGDYKSKANGRPSQTGLGDNYDPAKANKPDTLGRWPANLVLSHAEGCRAIGTRKVRSGEAVGRNRNGEEVANRIFNARKADTQDATYADPDGTETVEAWECVEGCPVAELDRQSGEAGGWYAQDTTNTGRSADGMFGLNDSSRRTSHADSGGASRFFYVAKPSTAEREEGLAIEKAWHELAAKKRANIHPTVKAVALMRWLARLITPPGGLVLDPFTGSGSTGVACAAENFRFIGIERDADYHAIAEKRIRQAYAQGRLFA